MKWSQSNGAVTAQPYLTDVPFSRAREAARCVCLFVCTMLSVNSDCIASDDWMVVNSELARIWKKALVAKFEVLFWNLSGWSEEELGKH